jgi:hypothetical protein
LASLLGEEGDLQRVQRSVTRKPFDGLNNRSRKRLRRPGAGEDRHAIREDHARATLLKPAAEAGASKAKTIPEHEKKSFILLGGDLYLRTVDRYGERFRHARRPYWRSR